MSSLSLAPVTGGVPGTYQDAVARGGANSGNLFRYDRTGRHYIFDLDTRNLAPGVWSLKADLGDGVTHAVNVTVTR